MSGRWAFSKEVFAEARPAPSRTSKPGHFLTHISWQCVLRATKAASVLLSAAPAQHARSNAQTGERAKTQQVSVENVNGNSEECWSQKVLLLN